MAIKTLDALALASLDELALLKRIGAIWCRAHNNRCPNSRNEISCWIRGNFGPIIPYAHRDWFIVELIDEVNRQIKTRVRRRRRAEQIDPLNWPNRHPIRINRLLASRLGPARLWVSQTRAVVPEHVEYTDGWAHSGLVFGLVPVAMQLRRVSDPRLLIYRHQYNETKVRWVPTHINTVSSAIQWLVPADAADFLQLPDTQVKHDWENQTVQLITMFGTKVLPWRELIASR